MNDAMNAAVDRVIEMMYQRVGDTLTIDDMAQTALYSKFHFSRAFRQVTGVSPGRFLAALRFQEAKRLLTSSSLSVAEISNRVGYSSLGTFSARFKWCVGVTPTEYRRHGGRLAPATRPVGDDGDLGAVQGLVSLPAADVDPAGGAAPDAVATGPTFVGLYPQAVALTSPVCATLLGAPGPYTLEGVPDGTWYVVAHAAGALPADPPPTRGHGAGGDSPPAHPAGVVGLRGPISVRGGASLEHADVQLRPMRTVDFPVLSAPVAPLAPAGSGAGLRKR